jgi:hypothetical protein
MLQVKVSASQPSAVDCFSRWIDCSAVSIRVYGIFERSSRRKRA